MLSISFAFWSVASLLTPGDASSTTAIIMARVFVGIAQGFIIPAIHTELSQVGAEVPCAMYLPCTLDACFA